MAADISSWIAAAGATGAFLAAPGTLIYQRQEIKALEAQLRSANSVVELSRLPDQQHLLRLAVRNTGPGIARSITVEQDPWHSKDYRVGVPEAWSRQQPVTLRSGQDFALMASGPALGAEHIATIVICWVDGNGKQEERVLIDFLTPL